MNVKENLITHVKNSNFFFVVQPDESTVITNYTQLLRYVRHIFENTITDNYLFYETRTTVYCSLNI